MELPLQLGYFRRVVTGGPEVLGIAAGKDNYSGLCLTPTRLGQRPHAASVDW